ncbi:hypothetical protein BU26DRAFT_320753 [Trematosphaeria pertusa]|uniref:Uncharacterized protein n=1 Tax=Trematosphaeria pertusa TaxID=390896 RepID=A0A6A6IC67_9PLEO|nr:uncharacterized protein BU26DRAFT_320753 [Trematosphaeria pertusa]KAF2247797.1 hypothetical protein BU26DRAFT_320753 [Trematosphaeria pertusa]
MPMILGASSLFETAWVSCVFRSDSGDPDSHAEVVRVFGSKHANHSVFELSLLDTMRQGAQGVEFSHAGRRGVLISVHDDGCSVEHGPAGGVGIGSRGTSSSTVPGLPVREIHFSPVAFLTVDINTLLFSCLSSPYLSSIPPRS